MTACRIRRRSRAVTDKCPRYLSRATASDNTKKQIRDKCAFYGAACRGLPLDTAALAHAVGKTGTVGAVAVTDGGFADSVTALLDSLECIRTLSDSKPPDEILQDGTVNGNNGFKQETEVD